MTKDQFIDTVRRWVKKDVERMMQEIPAQDGEDGNINFPLALCVLAYIETLGSYLIGGYQKGGKPTVDYVAHCFADPAKYDALLLHKLFRNGLAHEYFPQGGVSRDNYEYPMYATTYDGDEIVVVDAETLANDFLASLDSFYSKLTAANYEARRSQIEADRAKLMSENAAAVANLHRRTPRPKPTALSTDTNAKAYTISGASTAKGPLENVVPLDEPTSSTAKTTTSTKTSPVHTTTLEPEE